METIKTIAKVNEQNVQIIEKNGNKYVPIKPICKALGIDFKSQYDKLKKDKILSSVMVLSTTTATDNKNYEMVSIPLKFIFGWLFRINPKNVKPEAEESIIKYQLMCYDALYSYFTEKAEFIEEKQQKINTALDRYNEIQKQFKETKSMLAEQKKELEEVRNITFEQWKNNKRQLEINFSQ